MAIRAMDVLRFELGLRVPQDVSVIGFDDTLMASLPTYNLTTVRQPVSAMVDSALRLLFERIEQPDAEAAHLILRPHLIERGSVRSGFS
jgi:DNA-binding LacI/PurR family transcriptional regulator